MAKGFSTMIPKYLVEGKSDVHIPIKRETLIM